MTKHLASKTKARGFVLRGFVFTMAFVAASFQAASSESLQMMEVSDRLPQSQPLPARETSVNATNNPTPTISRQAEALIANTLQQPTLTQVPNPTTAAAVQPQQIQTTNARSMAIAVANASAARDEAFFAAALKQPLLTQIPSPPAAAQAKTSNPQRAPVAYATSRDQAFFDAALKQPDLSPYATAADNSQMSQPQRSDTKIAATAAPAPVRNEPVASADLRQPDMTPPSYTAAIVQSQVARPQVAAAKPAAPAVVAATPMRSDASASASLQQPDLSQPTIASSGVLSSINQPPTAVAKPVAPAVVSAAPAKIEPSVVADLKQPNMIQVMPSVPIAESRPQIPAPETKSTPPAIAAAPVRSEPVAIAPPNPSPAVVDTHAQQLPSAEVPSAKVATAAPKTQSPEHVEAVAVAQLKQPNMNPSVLPATPSESPAPQARFADSKTSKPEVQGSPIVSPVEGKMAVAAQPAAPLKTAELSQPLHGQYALDTSANHSMTNAEDSSGGATKPMSETPTPAPAPTPIDGGCPCGCAYGPCQSGARNICGVDCGRCGAPCCATWKDARCIPWSFFGPGEYVGPARTEHVSTYYLRVNDLLRVTYIASRVKASEHYRMGVGDRLRIEWLRMESSKDPSLDRDILVQPDGNVILPLVGPVPAAGRTVEDFRDDVTKLYSRYQKEPQITVTPTEVNTGLQDILRAVTSVSGSNGQSQDLRVTPEGTIQAPGLGSIYVQGLTLDELRTELEARYAATFGPGLLVSPALTERATSYVFVGGEVKTPGRFTLEGPTTVMQAIALAGGWNVGGNTRQVVVFRRDENWCLKATKINLHAPLYGQDPCPVNDTWLRDNDLVLVPKERILCADDVIELYFTRGAYSVFPVSFFYDLSKGSAVTAVP